MGNFITFGAPGKEAGEGVDFDNIEDAVAYADKLAADLPPTEDASVYRAGIKQYTATGFAKPKNIWLDALWERYEAAGPGGDRETAELLGKAYFLPGQRSSQDAFPAGKPMNIMDLSAFSAGWARAKAVSA